MPFTSQGELLSSTEVLTKGLRKNLAKLATRGIDEPSIVEIEELRASLAELEAEQEAQKSRLKEKTAAIVETQAALKAKVSDARKIVKLQIPQLGWREFGISDVR